ncbi:unnamed protein product [Acanthoscelides obtectus]|uniref:Uncharacterized protein n=1 Tax=Acanthoscelides obtectus TaxID=200917 RepID=A0A9P0KUB1_ACAOB|nr:unnamed protein product [Acanthoscelides obtectus]CAK1674967.1 Regulator of G-protein signaling loco [Acanthoscelides obtectus]
MDYSWNTGYLGNSRVVLNHYDVSTQADIQHVALSYESEDEIMGRLHSKERRGTAHYSKQDIREQYCISDRGLGALENNKQSLFGCLSSHHGSPCSARSSLLTACVRQKVPSDENLYDLYKKHPSEYAPYPRRNRNPWGPVTTEMHCYDEDLTSSYFRRKQPTDPSRYTWMPSDDESIRMEKPRSIIENSYHPPYPLKASLATQQNNSGQSGTLTKKHVSFARSHTMASFDDAMSSLSSSTGQLNRITRSQERLLDVRKTEIQPITKQPEPENFLDKVKRAAPMKTQATQTEIGLGRKPLPYSHINLSPKTAQRVKMVSQGAQTNGYIGFNGGRKLVKSFSEVGDKFGAQMTREGEFQEFDSIPDHEPLQRTQSDEPPRSPFIVDVPSNFVLPPEPPAPIVPPFNPLQSDTSSLSNQSEDSESKREIFIDFKPQLPAAKASKKALIKTMSDGEILLEQRKSQKVNDNDCVVPEKPTSVSHENITAEDEPINFRPYFQKAPIRNEGICRPLEENIYSSLDAGIQGQDSIDEEFHENIIYNRIFLNRQDSNAVKETRQGESVVPSVRFMPDSKLSPFTSNDSLNNDARDQSDGIWNESQATVLQVDSGTENGTALSSSEMTSATSPGSTTLLLTPSSRRRHLLMMQHQQRSSMDTENLDEEVVDNVDTSPGTGFPRIVVDRTTSNELSSAPRRFLTVSPSPVPSVPQWRPPAVPPAESPQPAAVVPDLLLARTDSCKTNTDVSESTTTDDYMTANSGTDSSRRSGSIKSAADLLHHMHYQHRQQHNSSSLAIGETGSSFDSLKGSDDMAVVPSAPFTPPSPSLQGSPTPPAIGRAEIGNGGKDRPGTPSDDESSSSCGSYSVDGASTPDLLDRSSSKPHSAAGSPTKKSRAPSEDERSVHYSSSGYYESPIDDDLTWKSIKYENHRQPASTTVTTTHNKKDFTLDLPNNPKPYLETYNFPANPTSKHTKTNKRESRLSPSTEAKTTVTTSGEAKPKRVKARMRSPMQNHKKAPHNKKSFYGSAALLDEKENKATSDESSCDAKRIGQQNSPRKAKKNKENSRRKSLPRSPVNQRSSSKHNDDDKPSSLPGSLSRRSKSNKHYNAGLTNESEHNNKRYSPSGSPSSEACLLGNSIAKKTHNHADTKLKALSAESLRSVSPGSDSVFYSDPSSHAAMDQQVHCLHCGKEVDIVNTDEADKSIGSSSTETQQQDIVQPPAGFEDSPRMKTQGRLFKKLDRRIRSEERTLIENRKHRYKSDVRAKSEERASRRSHSPNSTGVQPQRPKSTPQLRSGASSGSSPSLLPAAPEDEDDPSQAVYDAPYLDGLWVYVDERDEVAAGGHLSPNEFDRSKRKGSVSSTESEQEFKRRYQANTHRMVHRKSCLEMYKRQDSKSFENGSIATGESHHNHLKNGYLKSNGCLTQNGKTISDEHDYEEENMELREKLEEIVKLMLVIWCQQNKALYLVSNKRSECDKTVIVHRECSGEFGFRIHGSKPVVVSAIEPGTPAEASGLEVGDIVIAVNGVSVLDRGHSEVVKIAHAGTDTLKLEVARTCYAISTSKEELHSSNNTLYNGYLWKLSGYASGTTTNKWIRRWFCLKQNNCLYYYKTDSDKQPVGVVMLFDQEVRKVDDDEGGLSKPYRFIIRRPDAVPLQLAADTSNAQERWIDVICKAVNESQIVDDFLEQTKRNLLLPPNAIHQSDCFGYLVKLGNQWKSASRRYCVLKDACLYFYHDANAKSAFGVAYLHGYRVQQSLSGTKKHAFEIIPPDPSKKHYYFQTETDADRKRWIAALEYSIDRWLKVT